MHRPLNLQVESIPFAYDLDQRGEEALEIPPFNRWGYLPRGVYDACFEQVIQRFATDPTRKTLCQRLEKFLLMVIDGNSYSHAYIGGDFTTTKTSPKETAVILQTRDRYGPEAFRAIEPLLNLGLEAIFKKYSVRLNFWCPGFPVGINDFRDYFESMRPNEVFPVGMSAGVKKGVVAIKL